MQLMKRAKEIGAEFQSLIRRENRDLDYESICNIDAAFHSVPLADFLSARVSDLEMTIGGDHSVLLAGWDQPFMDPNSGLGAFEAFREFVRSYPVENEPAIRALVKVADVGYMKPYLEQGIIRPENVRIHPPNSRHMIVFGDQSGYMWHPGHPTAYQPEVDKGVILREEFKGPNMDSARDNFYHSWNTQSFLGITVS